MKAVLCFCLIAAVTFVALGEAKTLSDSEAEEGVGNMIADADRKIMKSKLPNAELSLGLQIFQIVSFYQID
jgi:hypothetical protein